MSEMICYCFRYTEDDIIQDVRAHNGRSLIMERIATEKKAGQCRCIRTNPAGRWCMADVRRVVDRAAIMMSEKWIVNSEKLRKGSILFTSSSASGSVPGAIPPFIKPTWYQGKAWTLLLTFCYYNQNKIPHDLQRSIQELAILLHWHWFKQYVPLNWAVFWYGQGAVGPPRMALMYELFLRVSWISGQGIVWKLRMQHECMEVDSWL